MDTLFNNTTKNPRGIPAAPFVEQVGDLVKPEDFDLVMAKFQERLEQYKYMLNAKSSSYATFKQQIPEISNTLRMVKHLDSNGGAGLETNYQLNETLYTRAEVTGPVDKVGLWLGADVMLEYPIAEAVTLLEQKLKDAEDGLSVTGEDMEFLREQITTMEVNTARLYNWDVERRQSLKKAEEGIKNL